MMPGPRNRTAAPVLYGCLACLVFVFVVNADSRVFVLEPRNSSGLQSYREAENACASQNARLASAEELRHAVMECFFSLCMQGWLYGGTVGTTVCNIVGGALKAVDVRTENATGDMAYLDAICIKDTGVPCGDPPSFPNTRLQAHPSGFEMGDELQYTCAPGYVMPSGHTAFTLLCDSCGEWYGMVQICVKDETVSHVDYEDKFTNSYEEDHHNPTMEDAQGGSFEGANTDPYLDEKTGHQQQETSYGRLEHQDQQRKVEEDRIRDEERPVEDFVGHPSWEQERRQVVRTDAGATTEASVSLLSQKHMFWFPSEAFQEEVQSVSANPATQPTQRTTGLTSEESKEQESRETDQRQQSPHDAGDHHPEQETFDNHETSDGVDHDDSRLVDHEDRDDVVHVHRHDDDHYNHSDHYDMGEHEDDRIRHGNRGYDDREDTYDQHESYEDHEDVTDDPDVVVQVHTGDWREHVDQDDVEENYDSREDLDNNSHSDHDSHDHDDHDSHDRHHSHEDDSHQQIVVSFPTDDQQNLTKNEEGETTTDETWLDGYPVVPAGAGKGEYTTASDGLDQRESGTWTTERPNEVEPGRVPGTSSPGEPKSYTEDNEKVMEVWPGWISAATPHPGHLDPSYSDNLDYDTQQPRPTPSWPEDHLLDQGPSPSLHENDILVSVMEDNNLPGEAGERGEKEGELGETICVGEECPPHPPSSSMKGSTVTAVIVAVCLLAAAVMVGVWCYRRLQQKSSVYEMNGKGQSRTRQGQQIEMQQKV